MKIIDKIILITEKPSKRTIKICSFIYRFCWITMLLIIIQPYLPAPMNFSISATSAIIVIIWIIISSPIGMWSISCRANGKINESKRRNKESLKIRIKYTKPIDKTKRGYYDG